MPTGYTAAVADGTMTEFSAFALQCARAFGALILMRDDPAGTPIPEEFKSSNYHDKQIAQSKERLVELQAMSPARLEQEAILSYNAECERRMRRLRENDQQLERYTAMLLQAKAYVAPTQDHEQFRAFMIEQLEESIKFDCSTFKEAPLTQQTGNEWLAEQIKRESHSLEYHAREAHQEVRRAAERTQWVKALRESLKDGA